MRPGQREPGNEELQVGQAGAAGEGEVAQQAEARREGVPRGGWALGLNHTGDGEAWGGG